MGENCIFLKKESCNNACVRARVRVCVCIFSAVCACTHTHTHTSVCLSQFTSLFKRVREREDERERAWERAREAERGKERERQREREGERGRERAREREGERDRERDAGEKGTITAFSKKKEVYIRDTAFITIINAGPPEIIGGTASIHVEACIRGFTVLVHWSCGKRSSR